MNNNYDKVSNNYKEINDFIKIRDGEYSNLVKFMAIKNVLLKEGVLDKIKEIDDKLLTFNDYRLLVNFFELGRKQVDINNLTINNIVKIFKNIKSMFHN